MRKGMKLYIQRHGFIENDLAWNLAVPVPGDPENKHPQAEWIKVPCYTVLIHHPEAGWILYDAGPHPDCMNRPFRGKVYFYWYSDPGDHLERQLAKVGLKPAEIDTLIVSHIHGDHVANVRLFEGTKAGASIIVEKREFQAALLNTFAAPAGKVSPPRELFALPGLGYKAIEADTCIADGVELITLEGHSPGMLGLVVHLPKTGTSVFPSDAILDRRNWGPPPRMPGRIYDSLGWYRTIDKLNGILKQYNGTIIYPHDLEQFETLKQTPEYYE